MELKRPPDNRLKAHLFDAYNGFADKRFKNLDKSDTFVVDDRRDGDYGADGNLLSNICSILARTTGPESLEISLSGNVPMSDAIRAWARANKFDTGNERSTHLTVALALGQEERLEQLAGLIADITKPGKRYDTPSYKYACPRTVASLRKLAAVLREFGKKRTK